MFGYLGRSFRGLLKGFPRKARPAKLRVKTEAAALSISEESLQNYVITLIARPLSEHRFSPCLFFFPLGCISLHCIFFSAAPLEHTINYSTSYRHPVCLIEDTELLQLDPVSSYLLSLSAPRFVVVLGLVIPMNANPRYCFSKRVHIEYSFERCLRTIFSSLPHHPELCAAPPNCKARFASTLEPA